MLNKSTNIENDTLTQKTTTVINDNDGILNLNTELLYKEYCTNNFNENSIGKYEKMHNDFKIIL
jgi:hypothetical protein